MNSTYKKLASEYNADRLSRISKQLSKVQELIDRFNEQATKNNEPIILSVDNNSADDLGKSNFQLHMFQFSDASKKVDLECKDDKWAPTHEQHFEVDEHGTKFFVLIPKAAGNE